MNEFDDRELRDALRRRAGAPTEGFGLEAAHSAVVARAGRVRRRRAAVAGGAAMAGLVAAAVFVIGPGTDSVVTTPGDRTTAPTPASVDATAPVTTDPGRTTVDISPPVSTSPGPVTTVPSFVPSTATTTGTAPPTGPPAEPGTTVSTTPSSSPEPTPPTSGSTPSTTAAPGPAPFTDTYSATGGSITVHWDGAALSLVATSPATGFEAEVEDERADRIRVRFHGDGGDVRIEIRFEDGQVVRVE